MSNLLASMSTAGNALGVYQQALEVIQNNISNSATPGYAKQTVNLLALPFDVASGLAGGVYAKGLDSARDEYAEAEVRRQLQSLGRFEGQTQGLSAIENLFDVTGDTGISASLDRLFASFSAWSVTPASVPARQTVLASAAQLADDVRRLASSLSAQSRSIESQIDSTVDRLNELTSSLQQLNVERLRRNAPDPGLDAQMHAALEELSGLVDISTLAQADGTVTVLLNGGSPLVIGPEQYPVRSQLGVAAAASNPQSPPLVGLVSSDGVNITGQIDGGKLAGLLDVHNRVLSSMMGDGEQAGSLNEFAGKLADTINGILQSGYLSTDPASPNGYALFKYDSTDPTAAARSLTIDPNMTPDRLAAVDPDRNSNGNAILLAGLAASSANGGINGATFADFFGQITASVGRESATAAESRTAQEEVAGQVRQLRDQISGVSLDEQAVLLLQFQKSYQAAARLLTTLNDLADTTINLIRL